MIIVSPPDLADQFWVQVSWLARPPVHQIRLETEWSQINIRCSCLETKRLEEASTDLQRWCMSKGGQTRQRIVAKAATLFNQRGFDGSSMADLMEATGLEKGGIYRHFSTKEELAEEAFDYAWQAATEVGMRDLDSVPNSVNKLKRFISNFIDQRPSVPGGGAHCSIPQSLVIAATPSCGNVPAKPCTSGKICSRGSSGRE